MKTNIEGGNGNRQVEKTHSTSKQKKDDNVIIIKEKVRT